MAKKKKCWSWSTGQWGYKVRVHEDHCGSNLFLTIPDKSRPCGFRSQSLGHRDRELAKEAARKVAGEWMAKGKQARSTTPTLGRLLDLFLAERTPLKVESEQSADRRRAEMWRKLLIPGKDVRTLSSREWHRFIADRSSGAVDADGNRVLPENRRPTGTAAVAGDLIFLSTVLNHATNTKVEGTDQYLLDRNPAKGGAKTGFPIPKERNPRRPVATHDRYLAILAVADQVKWSSSFAESVREGPSYLKPVLQLDHSTGRRISAILALRFEDLRLDQGPHGSIRWPADTDKMGKEWSAPLNEEGREAIDRILAERPGIGAAYIFPDPRDQSKPVSKYVMDRLHIEAEKFAGVPHLKGGLWHSYRRKWATERKHFPIQDVMRAGGWSEPTSLQNAYQQADEATVLEVVTTPKRLREVK